MKKLALIAALTTCAPMAHAATAANTESFDFWAWAVSFFEMDSAESVDGSVTEASLANIDTALGLGPR